MPRIFRIAVVEDDPATSALFAGWLQELVTSERLIKVDQFLSQEQAVRQLSTERYDLVCLDMEMDHVRTAGFSIIKTIIKNGQHGQVLVISGLPIDSYQPIMKALDAWDFLVKPLVGSEHKAAFHGAVVRALRQTGIETEPSKLPSNGFIIDPINLTSPLYKGQRLNLSLTQQRIIKLLMDRPNQLVTREELYKAILSGQNADNLRRHISDIRESICAVYPSFNAIQSVPMAGYIWRE